MAVPKSPTLIHSTPRYLEYTVADWLLLIATAHVFAPVVVFHSLRRTASCSRLRQWSGIPGPTPSPW